MLLRAQGIRREPACRCTSRADLTAHAEHGHARAGRPCDLEYRNERVRLPYGSADGATEQAFLTIPDNLYLIGTMNSTDRSLALIDYALRRRFYFYAFRPAEGARAPVLEGWLAEQEMSDTERQRVSRLFIELNRKVQQDLSADFQIGHSYFMTRDIGTAVGRERVWRRAVRPRYHRAIGSARRSTTIARAMKGC
jgi:5-methylcytosine-specific restriction endonuclease McrBC GTP-binding regulatory subunit McrB